eukprot:1248387-Amphidinium_carterae.2
MYNRCMTEPCHISLGSAIPMKTAQQKRDRRIPECCFARARLARQAHLLLSICMFIFWAGCYDASGHGQRGISVNTSTTPYHKAQDQPASGGPL